MCCQGGPPKSCRILGPKHTKSKRIIISKTQLLVLPIPGSALDKRLTFANPTLSKYHEETV